MSDIEFNQPQLPLDQGFEFEISAEVGEPADSTIVVDEVGLVSGAVRRIRPAEPLSDTVTEDLGLGRTGIPGLRHPVVAMPKSRTFVTTGKNGRRNLPDLTNAQILSGVSDDEAAAFAQGIQAYKDGFTKVTETDVTEAQTQRAVLGSRAKNAPGIRQFQALEKPVITTQHLSPDARRAVTQAKATLWANGLNIPQEPGKEE
jgi:hypothetical protein